MKRREFIADIGAATAWPLAVRAQQPKKIPTVGILWHAGSREEEGILYDSMHAGFAALGYAAGKNVVFEERFPGEVPGRFERFANELVQQPTKFELALNMKNGQGAWADDVSAVSCAR